MGLMGAVRAMEDAEGSLTMWRCMLREYLIPTDSPQIPSPIRRAGKRAKRATKSGRHSRAPRNKTPCNKAFFMVLVARQLARSRSNVIHYPGYSHGTLSIYYSLGSARIHEKEIAGDVPTPHTRSPDGPLAFSFMVLRLASLLDLVELVAWAGFREGADAGGLLELTPALPQLAGTLLDLVLAPRGLVGTLLTPPRAAAVELGDATGALLVRVVPCVALVVLAPSVAVVLGPTGAWASTLQLWGQGWYTGRYRLSSSSLPSTPPPRHRPAWRPSCASPLPPPSHSPSASPACEARPCSGPPPCRAHASCTPYP
jgi:hypothetical protein